MRTVILLALVIGLAESQLNFEGDPLTENTEYTAEESRYSSRRARQEESTRNHVQGQTERPQKLYPVYEKPTVATNALPRTGTEQPDDRQTADSQVSRDTPKVASEVTIDAAERNSESGRQLQQASYNQLPLVRSVDPADVALNTFLNSRTPEESQASLDYYIRTSQIAKQQTASQQTNSQQTSSQQIASQQPRVSDIVLPQLARREPSSSDQQRGRQEQPVESLTEVVGSQPGETFPRVVQGQTVHVNGMHAVQGQQSRQSFPQTAQGQQGQNFAQVTQGQQSMQTYPQTYNYVGTSVSNLQPMVGTPLAGTGQVLQQIPFAASVPGPVQARADYLPRPGWMYNRFRRLRKPFPYAQSRIGPGIYKPTFPGPSNSKEPAEVIYTRPPGFHRPPRISNPPVPYEDASAWFPDADYPPPPKDVYYSQLYAQSYDPYYYNYIAKTGKIKPHLYGKLGKHRDEQDDGIWAELYRGFKKHGLKNIMTPTFLLGMTIPAAITLMISALVQKRSLSRSDSRDIHQDAIQEYLERLQRAMECYEKRRRKDGDAGNEDGC